MKVYVDECYMSVIMDFVLNSISDAVVGAVNNNNSNNTVFI